MSKILIGKGLLTVYTAVFGNYDILNEPLYVDPEITYICFTDSETLKSSVWDIIVVKKKLSSRREARKYKILSHKYIDSEISLWIDGSCQLKENPFPYIKEFLEISDFVLTNHPRGCLYKEAQKCLIVKKGNPQKIKEQIERYKEEKYPEDNGLVDSTVVLRRMTPEVIQIENDWWDEIVNGCVRDQVSFNYVAWKNDFEYGLFNYKKIVKRRNHRRRIEVLQGKVKKK